MLKPKLVPDIRGNLTISLCKTKKSQLSVFTGPVQPSSHLVKEYPYFIYFIFRCFEFQQIMFLSLLITLIIVKSSTGEEHFLQEKAMEKVK